MNPLEGSNGEKKVKREGKMIETTNSILVADDERGLRESFRMILKDHYNVLVAENGAECLRIVKEKRPNLVLLDVRMPGVDGIEVLKEIKKIDSRIPIIIITAAGTHQMAIEALKLGASDFIAKPFDLHHVREVIENNLLQATYETRSTEIKETRKTLPSVEDVLRKDYLAALKTLTKVIEAKDPYTRDHSKQVSRYAVEIAREMGFTEDEVEVMEQTALLHDIGKVGLSDLILHKSTKLTPQEWEAIKRHPQIGEEILEPLKLLHIEQSMIRHHHERFDGRGYPDGLAGEEIPLYARILAVADSYDAMTSSRPYRAPLTPQEARAELKRGSDTQFDPQVVEAFLKILERNVSQKGEKEMIGDDTSNDR